MVNRKKLQTLAYNLNDLKSLRNVFSELNFDFVDEPVNKENWNDEEKAVVLDSKIIAKHEDYLIYYIQTNTDSLKQWKSVSTKLIKQNHGLCLVVLHNPSGFKWVFSSLSKEFSKSFTETRHVPIEIRPNIGVPENFVDFLEKLEISKDSTTASFSSQISEAFDTFAIEIHNELTVNVFEALKVLSCGIISEKHNKLSLSNETLDEIRESVFIILYRIIFILYAEDRGIFPIDNPIYYDEFSIKWIKQELLLKFEKINKLKEYEVQKRLSNLFHLIEVGSEELNYSSKNFYMSSYYGRLFAKTAHPQLASWKISNKHLLDALSFLTRTSDTKGNYFFLDYSALETRHLGAIYEHLLEFHLKAHKGKIIDLPDPNERKTSGSYYTPKFIVNYVVQHSIEPHIQRIIKENSNVSLQIEKILSLKILDPAMGSGHFLIGAIEYLAKRLCEIEFGEELQQHHYEIRKRDVVRKCIYGVDINPLAVDLAKLSLWLETLTSDKPLSFLNAHLKHGNSLIGEFISSVFDAQQSLFETKTMTHFKKTVKDFLGFESFEDDTASAVKAKVEKYDQMISKGTFYHQLRGLLDHKLAESFGNKAHHWRDLRQKIGVESLDFYSSKDGVNVNELRKKISFFHWEIEFPEIFFTDQGEKKNDPGFDVVIGNPPWEKLKIQDREFFASRDPKISNAATASIRKNLIEKLVETNPGLVQEYQERKKNSEEQTAYLRDSKKFPLSAVGDINLYPIFLELSKNFLRKNGRCGMIVKTGIVTDSSYQKFFASLISNSYLQALHDFTNKRNLFEGVIANERFSLLFLKNSEQEDSNFLISVLNEGEDDLLNDDKKYLFYKSDVELFNPNTKTCPLFRTKKDFTICKVIYEKNPVLIKEKDSLEINPWNIEYWRMFDMTNDSALFHQKELLIKQGFKLDKNSWFVSNNKKYIPLYEAKFFSNYNHRHGSFENVSVNTRFGVKAEPYHPNNNQLENPQYEIEPRYWVPLENVLDVCKRKNVPNNCFFCFRNVCRAFTDSRTARGTIVPFSGVGNSAPILIFRDGESDRRKRMTLFSCVFSSFTFDYLVRQKLSGANLNKFILIQIAAPTPESFDKTKLKFNDSIKTTGAWCLEKALNVFPVSDSLLNFFKDCGLQKTVKWEPNMRFDYCCFIDAIVAHTYGLNSKDYEYILNQFPILKKQEEGKYGKFLSFDKCLDYFNKIQIVN